MSGPGALVPPPGNPMRPTFFMFAVFFPALIVGFPLYVYATGGPVGETIAIVWLLGIVAVISLGALVWGARSIERERRRLMTADVWASWQLTKEEYSRFVRAEWRREAAWIAGLLAIALGVPLLTTFGVGDLRIIGLMVTMGLAIFLIGLAAEMPPFFTNERTREVRIGANGVEAMGDYVQLRGSGRGLEAVGLSPGDPPVLVFRTYVRNRRSYEVRVPVPADRVDEARKIVERFAPSPPAGETYPELLRRTRGQDAR